MTKSKTVQKVMAGVTAVMLVVMLLGGCQPTPEEAIVVNKREGIPSDALKETEQADAGEPDAHFEPATYSSSERWTDHIEKDEYFTFDVDVDVMMPDVEKFPVQKLERMEMTQETADRLIAYFAGDGAQFYKWPMPMTKDYYEEELIRLKESLAQVEAGGDGETPESIRSYIEAAEEMLAAAPETLEIEYVTDTGFTYQRNWETGKPEEKYGQNYINLGMDAADGGIATIFASRYEEGNLNSIYTGFGYMSANYENEAMYEDQQRWLEEDEKRLQYIDEEYRAEEQKYVDEQKERLNDFRTRIDQSDIDLPAMQQKAIQVFDDLGITGVQITLCDRALIGPQPKEQWYGYSYEYQMPDEDGCYIEFIRENGGIPCARDMGGSIPNQDDMEEGMYSAPFSQESGSMVLDAEGNVRCFWWNDCAQLVEQVAGDSELLPFDQIKGRAIDQLYWNNTYNFDEEYTIEDWGVKLRFEIDDVRLVMAYTKTKDEPAHVTMVPAWFIGAQGYGTYEEGETIYGAEESMWNYENVLINALDGSRILMPGLETWWAQDEMWQQEMEDEQQAAESGEDGGAGATPAPKAVAA